MSENIFLEDHHRILRGGGIHPRACLHRALTGGFIAALLLGLARRFMVYYFSHLAIVSVIYGSTATIIIMLLFMAAGAIILLRGPR